MKTALLLTQDLQRAGAQRQCVELAIGLSRTPGWRVIVATLEPGGPLGDDIDRAGIRLEVVPRRWRWDLSPAARLAGLVGRLEADVVHTFLFLPNFYGRLARLLRRPKLLVSSLRSTGIEGWPRYLTEVVLAPLCDLIIANSESGAADLAARGVRRDRIVVVRNGIDLSRFAPPAPAGAATAGDVRIGMVAQMESRKDHLGLVEAFALLHRHHPGLKLVLAGDGSRRPLIDSRVAERGLQGSVEMPGTVNRPEEVYRRLAIYVQASAAEEGTSNSVLEAMASGLPVVATDIGGNRETVQHGVTGLIVPPRDPAALAEAVRELLERPDRARAMGEAAARRVHEQYSRETLVRATLAAYAAAAARRGA